MRILAREPITTEQGPSALELELRAQLSAAHLEAHEARARLIDAERKLAQNRIRLETAEATVAALGQLAERWEIEARTLQEQNARLNAALTVRISRLARAVLRRAARILPARVKNVLRATLRRARHALPV